MSQPQPYPIVGLEGTGTHLRLEINDLRRDPIQFSLFIRAWNRILDMKTTDDVNKPNSWWQIGTIHGRPFEQWTGDPNGPKDPADPNSYGGYCYHAAVLFPTWHRVQLLLAEQAVVREAIDIASKLPDNLSAKRKWVQAANALRFPFWDWTSEQTAKEGIPEIFQKPRISIINPSSSKDEEVRNPLNHYQFPDNYKPGPGDTGMGVWSRTYRWVDFASNPPLEDYSKPRDLFAGNDADRSVRGLRAKIAGLFKYPILKSDESDYRPNLWGRFSNTNGGNIYIPPQYEPLAATIEEPHNWLHLNIGGNGTMSSPSYAGFDPIFFLHHCNVDRIYAFWECVYPDYWLGNKGWKNKDGGFTPFITSANFSQADGSEVKADTSLIPFRTKHGYYWTSEQVRGLLNASTTQKYYTYPGIRYRRREFKIELDASTYPAEDREKFRQALYNQWRPDLNADVDIIRTVFRSRSWNSQLRSLLLEESETAGRSYLRNFVIIADVPEFAYPGSYRLEFYLLPEDRLGSVSVIDTVSVFGRQNPDECAACIDRRAAGSSVRGHIYLYPDDVINLINRWSSEHPKDRWPHPAELPNVPHHSLDWFSNVVKWSFGLRVVKPDGTRLASADPRIDANGEDLEEGKKPRLTLHSHRISFDSNSVTAEADYVPLAYEGAEYHGEFELGGRWKKT